jgi:predicted O-methyltransferase YrrM
MRPKFYATFTFFKLAFVGSIAALAALAALEWGMSWPVFLPGVAVLLLALALVCFRLLQFVYQYARDRIHDTNQVEALLWLYSRFTPTVNLPAMREVAGSPDFLKVLIEYYDKTRPAIIVEAGSGVSSIILSELLMKEGSSARHYALDHLEQYAALTREKVLNPHSEVLLAPLKDFQIDGKSWKWYDTSALDGVSQIDFLVIDGPTEDIQPLARYPALPLLKDKLSPNAIIILDDTNRAGEQAIIKRWKEEFGLQAKFLFTEKGACVMGRSV